MFIVIELQTNQSGVVGNIVTAFSSIELAYQKYYTILSAAAVSSLPVHAAVILNNHGEMIDYRYFEHEAKSS